MTPEQGRAEWQRWASRADELRRDVARYEALAEDAVNLEAGRVAFGFEWFDRLSSVVSILRATQQLASERLDALREYSPKETT